MNPPLQDPVPHQAGCTLPPNERTPRRPWHNAEINPMRPTQYQPRNRRLRIEGPRFITATEAALWCISQPQPGWEWEPV